MRRGWQKKTFKVGAVLVALASVSACNGSFRGVATMPSASAGGVATMAFNVICDPNTQEVSGNLTFSDSRSGAYASARATGYPDLGYPQLRSNELPEPGEYPYEAVCDNDSDEGHYTGTFTGTIDGRRQSGTMTFDLRMDAEDCGGQPWVDITLTGSSRFYENSGCVDVGTIRPVFIRTANGTVTPEYPGPVLLRNR
jgi:hypothetical protein